MIVSDAPGAEHLREYLYHASVGVIETDLSGQVILMNPMAVCLLMPLAPLSDLLSNLWTTLEPLVPEIRTLLDTGRGGTGHLLTGYRIVMPAGVHGQADAAALSLSVVKVGPDTLITTIADISEAVRYEWLLGKQEARLNATMAISAQHAEVVLDAGGAIASWNPAMERLTGITAAEAMGESCSLLFAPDAITPDRISDRLAEARQTGISFAEGKMRRAGGDPFWGQSILFCAEPSLRADGYILLLRDTGDHRETIDALLKAAKSDQLTGVANRRGLHEAATIEIGRHAVRPRDIALLLLDIDYFKQINDTYGHPVGDDVLRNLASVMLDSVRNIDVVARIGGEEFAVLLPSTDLAMAVRIAERIRARVATRRVRSGSYVIRYRVSIGVARFDGKMSGIDDLIASADRALYKAKYGGRDRVHVSEDAG